MGHHPIDELIELWKREKLTAEQAIGQMLQLLQAYEQRLREVARRLPVDGDDAPDRPGPSKRAS
jgi:hypothetical protein